MEKTLNATRLIYILAEGYHVREKVILNRVSKYKSKIKHTQYELFPCTSYSGAKYFLHNKWYPGFNDYPFGDDVNHDEVEIVQEWITGNFDYDEFEPTCENCFMMDMVDDLDKIFKKGKK